MVDTPVRWSWYPPINENKNGDPIRVYCCQCSVSIADGEQRASSSIDRRPHCEECALERGAQPPGEKAPKRKSAEKTSSAPSTPNAVASSEIIPLLIEIRDLLKQLVPSSGLKTEAVQDFSPLKEEKVRKPNPEEDPNWIATLERLEDTNKTAFQLVKVYGRLESWSDEEVVISMKEAAFRAMDGNKTDALALAVGLPLHLKPRSF